MNTDEHEALEVCGLTVDYRRRGERVRAVDDVDLTLRAGHTVALVGESGSGKSTVVRALARFVRPTAGTIRLHGSTAHRNRSYRHSLQLVFQDPFASLNPMHTVGHHLRRPLLVHGTDTPINDAVAELLTSVNLVPPHDIAIKRPHELSGGQRQRVAIARALATNPEILLADEPVSMLDVSIRLEILNLLDRLRTQRNLAMLYVTHDLATARHFASEILVMYRGQIVERGPSDQVILAPRHPYTQLLASAAPRRSQSRPYPGWGPVVAERRDAPVGEACVFQARCPHAMAACARRPPDIPSTNGDGVVRCWLAMH